MSTNPDDTPVVEEVQRAPEGDLEMPPNADKVAQRREQMLASPSTDLVGPGAEQQSQRVSKQGPEATRRLMRAAVGVTKIDRRPPIDIGGPASKSADSPPPLLEKGKVPKTFDKNVVYKVKMAMPVIYHGTAISPAHEVTMLGSALNEIVGRDEYKDAIHAAEKSS